MRRIILEPFRSKTSQRAQRYRVFFGDQLLIRDTWNPEFEAARRLVARGIIGPCEVWDRTLPYARSTIKDLEVAARLTIREDDRGLYPQPYVPFPTQLKETPS